MDEIKRGKAPDAKEYQSRPIEFGYDIEYGGHTAWLTEHVSRWEYRRTQICGIKDGQSTGFDGYFDTLESWGTRDPATGLLRLNNTPFVRAILRKIDRDPQRMTDMLHDAFQKVFETGFRPCIRLKDVAGDMQNMILSKENTISAAKDWDAYHSEVTIER